MKHTLTLLISLLLVPLATLHAADATNVNCCESQEPTAANSTIVLVVDQQSTTKPERWSFAAKEAGDYQVGLAWIAVDDSGSGVTVTAS